MDIERKQKVEESPFLELQKLKKKALQEQEFQTQQKEIETEQQRIKDKRAANKIIGRACENIRSSRRVGKISVFT